MVEILTVTSAVAAAANPALNAMTLLNPSTTAANPRPLGVLKVTSA